MMAARTLSRSEKAQLASQLRLSCMRIARRVRFESQSEVAPHQLSVLARLDDKDRTPRELAVIECVSAPSMTKTVAALVDRGWVLRTDDPTDGRQVILSLTRSGRSALRAAIRAREGWMATRIEGLDDEEIETLRLATEILQRVAAT